MLLVRMTMLNPVLKQVGTRNFQKFEQAHSKLSGHAVNDCGVFSPTNLKTVLSKNYMVSEGIYSMRKREQLLHQTHSVQRNHTEKWHQIKQQLNIFHFH